MEAAQSRSGLQQQRAVVAHARNRAFLARTVRHAQRYRPPRIDVIALPLAPERRKAMLRKRLHDVGEMSENAAENAVTVARSTRGDEIGDRLIDAAARGFVEVKVEADAEHGETGPKHVAL